MALYGYGLLRWFLNKAGVDGKRFSYEYSEIKSGSFLFLSPRLGVLVYPDSLLLKPLFQIVHFVIEDFVVVVFFKFADVSGQFRLLLDNLG